MQQPYAALKFRPSSLSVTAKCPVGVGESKAPTPTLKRRSTGRSRSTRGEAVAGANAQTTRPAAMQTTRRIQHRSALRQAAAFPRTREGRLPELACEGAAAEDALGPVGDAGP